MGTPGPGLEIHEPARLEIPARPALDIAYLTTRMTRGEETAYREFYAAYFSRLLRYLLVLTRGREEQAREALQATFLRVVRHIRRFESEAVFWSWLTVLARSAAVDENRKSYRYLGLLDRFFKRRQVEDATRPTDIDECLVTHLMDSMAQLAGNDRDLIERKYFLAETVKAIAASLDLSEKAVESRLTRLRRQLKQNILSRLHDEK